MLIAVALGCGKKGDPLPPLRKNPQPPTAVSIAQRGELLQVSCVAPRLTLEGVRLGVMDIELLRADGAGDFAALAGIAEEAKVAPGEALVFDAVRPESGTIVRFSVVARSEKHDSAPAGPVEFVVREVPPAPTALVAELRPGRVALGWVEALPSTLPNPPPGTPPEPAAPASAAPPRPAPTPSSEREELRRRAKEARAAGDEAASKAMMKERQSDAAPAGPSEVSAEPTPEPTPRPTPPAVGVLVYRRHVDEDYGPALNGAPLQAASFVDEAPPLDSELCYAVRTVVSLQPFVESQDSEEACLFSQDIAPPEAVVGVALLRQPEGIEVSWSRSQTADLAAYRIYRAHRGEPSVLLAELPADTGEYLDTDPPPAAVLEYTVTAVDATGNESPHSAIERIRTR